MIEQLQEKEIKKKNKTIERELHTNIVTKKWKKKKKSQKKKFLSQITIKQK